MLDATTIFDVNFSIIGDSTGALLPSTNGPDANGNLIGSFTAVIDPMLDVLSDNGGLTQTHGLLPGSPAIDAGSSSSSSDQRGQPFVRTSGNAADIGAFESQTLNFVVGDESDIVDDNFVSSALSLREAIIFANANPGEDFITFDPNRFNGSSFDTIHLTEGELTITDSVTITGVEEGVVISGDSAEDDITLSGTSITDLSSNGASQLDDNSRVLNITAAAGQVVTLNGLIITGGIAGDGGGIRNEAAELVINETTLAGNRALDNGGAIFNDLGTVTITGSTISGNETVGDNTSGGGIHTNTGAITLTNSTLSGNQATGLFASGGAVSSLAGDVTLNSVTVTNNSADAEGGGIFVFTTIAATPALTIDNTIVAGNTAVANPDLQFGSALPPDISFSLIGDNSGTNLASAPVRTPDANGNIIGSSALIIDPLLGNLADNGGLTLTHQPLASSPVIDAGGSSTLITDQRNIPLLVRNDGGGVDIGAFERHQFFLVVDNSSDVDDGDFSVGNLSLREALGITNTNPAQDTIFFNADVFNGEQSDVIRLQLGQLTISDGDVIDTGGAEVVISGDANGDDALIAGSFITDIIASDDMGTLDDNSDRVIDITAPEGEVVFIRGITVTGGNASSSRLVGAGIRNHDADLVLTDVRVSGNQTGTAGDGGGIFTSNGAVTLNNSIVSDNIAGSNGGGIVSSDGELVLNSSTVERNFSDSAGGGIYSLGNVITLNNSSVINNSTVSINDTISSGDGGGIFTFSADVTLNNSFVNSNTADEFGEGGGIFTSNGDVTLINSSVSDNTAGGDGGGVTTTSGDITSDRSTISGNRSGGNGGGITTSRGDILITNSTLSGNDSQSRGGGIYQRLGNVTHIANSTIFDNRSDDGAGGIHHAGTSSFRALTIENSIVAGHVAADGTGSDLFINSGIASNVSNSLIGSNIGTPLQATTAGLPDAMGNLIGTSTSPIDPLLGDLANNGGPTLTHALLPGSPAINAGGAVSVDIGDTDQRGEDRIADGQIDIGAFESDSTFLLGDVNRDGFVTFLDIAPFIGVLSANGDQDEADTNRDGAVTFLDIAPFIELLSSQTPVTSPQPAIAASSADLFDAQPELSDELLDSELDDVFEKLLL